MDGRYRKLSGIRKKIKEVEIDLEDLSIELTILESRCRATFEKIEEHYAKFTENRN